MYLRKVSHYVTAFLIHLSQDVEEERLYIEVECLVIQEEFGHQTQVLAVDLMVSAIHFKH